MKKIWHKLSPRPVTIFNEARPNLCIRIFKELGINISAMKD